MGGESLHRNMVVNNGREYPKLAAGPVGKQIHSIYQGRLKQFVDGGQYRGMLLSLPSYPVWPFAKT
jgi:alpha-mannosidase